MDLRERWNDPDEDLKAALEGMQAKIHTSIPVRVVKDSDGHTVGLQPLIKFVQRMPDGSQKLMDYPVISDAPVQFSGGGGVTMTHPIKEGDEGMAIISSRSIDTWHQQGGMQPQIDARMHDLSDAVYLPGIRSTPRKIKDVSTSAIETRSDDGKHKISMDAKTGSTTISIDEGKHTFGIDPKAGISMKTAMKLAVDASSGMDFKGAAHFADKLTSSKSIGAPSLQGVVGGFTGAALAVALMIGAMALTGVQSPQEGIRTARYALATWVVHAHP
jgi:hypothetical protein